MRYLLAVLSIVLLFMACDNGGMNDDDKGPFSLIGTWEAEGDMNVMGDERTYKSTLVFLNDTEYKQETHYKSKQGAFDLLYKNDGTYTADGHNLTCIDTYYNSDGSKGGTYTYPVPYNFINKNTLETLGPAVIGTPYITSAIFRRK
jgi:hypothetical protein